MIFITADIELLEVIEAVCSESGFARTNEAPIA